MPLRFLPRFVSALALASALVGCTGATLGENTPGGDTWLEGGAIAVDDRSETAFVLTTETPQVSGATARKVLRAVGADDGRVSEVADLTGRADPRILFPASGVLVMSEPAAGGDDELRLLDPQTFEETKRVVASGRYHGTRMAPSRRFIAVADNDAALAPIHVVDAATLEQRVIPHGGDWLEAMWLHGRDELHAIVFEDDASGPRARLLAWDVAALSAQGFPTGEGGLWADPRLDVSVDDIAADFAFSFTWVGVSPDDRWVVHPVQRRAADGTSAHELLVLEVETGAVRSVPNAKGPVGFTPDGSTIVSYADVGDGTGDQRLLLVDVETLEVDEQDVPITGGLSYFVSREGNFVVVGSSGGGQRLVLYDVDSGTQTQMDGPGVGLYEFVSRVGHDEIWLVDDQALYRLHFAEARFELVPTSFAPEHIAILPSRDRLVLDDARGEPKLVYFDPETRAVTREVPLLP